MRGVLLIMDDTNRATTLIVSDKSTVAIIGFVFVIGVQHLFLGLFTNEVDVFMFTFSVE